MKWPALKCASPTAQPPHTVILGALQGLGLEPLKKPQCRFEKEPSGGGGEKGGREKKRFQHIARFNENNIYGMLNHVLALCLAPADKGATL